ncbi:uncharacterized protein LOC135952567 [Calliphora vicina]|uniref:uncharacterized protein LOC135952567 n=1 Tax=Calliphora vicina TaxID=7373 RepID=UPI00325AF011
MFNEGCSLSSRKISNDHAQSSKGKLKYFPPQVNQKCLGCEELSQKFDFIVDILAEHKVLLDRIVTQNAAVTNMIDIFPINYEVKLKELDDILAIQRYPYIRQINILLGGNAERNLHNIFGSNIILNFNVDGSFGKKRLRDFRNVFSALIGAISTFSESADKTLRTSFQRQKKNFFKQTSRSKSKKNEQHPNENESSGKEE